MLAHPNDHRHGTATGYVTGCRCSSCRNANAARLRKYRRVGPSAETHGTVTGYVRGCRCVACCNADRGRRRDSKMRQLTTGTFTHGTQNGYTIGCRCRKCKAARAAGERRNRNRVQYRLSQCLRNRVAAVIRAHHVTKRLHTCNLIGCDIPTLMRHLESRFSAGMSFDNYGDWHVDHIVPCATFDLTQAKDQKKCFHYTNLQPLWAADHREKHRAAARRAGTPATLR